MAPSFKEKNMAKLTMTIAELSRWIDKVSANGRIHEDSPVRFEVVGARPEHQRQELTLIDYEVAAGNDPRSQDSKGHTHVCTFDTEAEREGFIKWRTEDCNDPNFNFHRAKGASLTDKCINFLCYYTPNPAEGGGERRIETGEMPVCPLGQDYPGRLSFAGISQDYPLEAGTIWFYVTPQREDLNFLNYVQARQEDVFDIEGWAEQVEEHLFGMTNDNMTNGIDRDYGGIDRETIRIWLRKINEEVTDEINTRTWRFLKARIPQLIDQNFDPNAR
jgi:hypothetical protein